MSVKDCVKDIVGKTISGVVVKQGKGPAGQLFLVFTDGTFFEIYANEEPISTAGVLDYGGRDEIRRRSTGGHRIIVDI